MERVPELLKSKIMSADEAAQLIRTGMTIGVSGFTSVGGAGCAGALRPRA